MPPPDPGTTDPVRALERRLARERGARLEAEAIAERVTRDLYETVQLLTRSTKVAELLGEVAVQANEAETAEEALEGALRSVCSYTGWPVGHAYVLSEADADELVFAGVWHAADESRFQAFRQIAARTSFRRGEGLPGRTLLTGEPAWITDLSQDANFPRVVAARECGLAAAFAAPVLIRTDTVAVLEFFATVIQPPDDNLLRVVGFVGAQLGRVLERDAAEARLTRQALYDGLTGLPNRSLLMDRLQGSLARAARGGRDVHVLYLDIDDFKSINDSRGHTEGDSVLAALAQRLHDSLRASDSVGRVSHDTVARLGGDEFAVVLEECARPDVVAERLQLLLRQPLQVDDHEVFVQLSIGSIMVAAGADAAPPESILAAANVAMHEAKRSGKSRHVEFQPRMHDEARRRHLLGEELRHALARSEFSLLYQPVVDLGTGAVVGAEALVRWNHPTRGMVPPDEFIRRAEETGLIVGLGSWVLGEACRQAVRWREAGAPDLTVAVNVSGRQLREPDFVSVVRAVLQETGLDPDNLCLELTESILMERDDQAIAMLTDLREDGVHLAIDDFGTGYSSLGALRQLPVDLLKIDRSFISSLPDDDDAATIAWAVVRLGHTLGLPVVAEGVETEEQREALRGFGCDKAQGYLFARPLAAEAFVQLLAPAVA
jgi:diguanylate cyclase (GGDEF)-like protein